MFQNPLKVKVDKESGVVTLSVRTNDYTVVCYRISISDFEVMIEQYKALLKD